MKPFAIAGIQMHLSATQSNVPAMCRKLDVLMYVYPWVEMVLFSELAPYGPILHNAQSFDGPVLDPFRRVAARHGVWLLPGSLFERDGGSVFNTTPVIAPDGTIVAKHRKLFPFLPYEEGVQAGDELVVFDVPEVGRFGVSICYDMWFPETTRGLVAKGAEVILHPSLTSTIDRPVELAIATASAAINQCFFFDINGLSAGGTGRSIVVGPAGDVLHQAGAGEEMIPIEVDFDRVRRSREVGLRGLGQPLKSFRDSTVDFPAYRERGGSEFLRSLGPLAKPQRASRSGVAAPDPAVLAAGAPPAVMPGGIDASRDLSPSDDSDVPQVGVAVSDSPHAPIGEADLPAGVSLPVPEPPDH